jgi:RNA polymerase sigma-70 factor (ECF subfamily)
MDEQALVKDALSGDLDAFNRLVLAYQDMAFNLAYRMLGDDSSAEDVTQKAFISAYRSLTGYRGGSFKSWVLKMVTNACYDELRHRKRHPTTPLEPEGDDDEEIESPRWLADDSPSPEESAERAELEDAIQNCLGELPDDFRMIVVLVDVEGLDYEQAAAATRNPLGTIKSRLARARLKMRNCLHGYWELLPSIFRLDNESAA